MTISRFHRWSNGYHSHIVPRRAFSRFARLLSSQNCGSVVKAQEANQAGRGSWVAGTGARRVSGLSNVGGARVGNSTKMHTWRAQYGGG